MTFMIAISGPLQASEEEAADEGKKPEQGIYLKVPPIVVPMYHNGHLRGNMTITLVVKIIDEEQRNRARKYLPRLTDAYVMEANRLSHNYFDVTRPVNVAVIGDNFQRVTNGLLGYKETHILISSVIINKN